MDEGEELLVAAVPADSWRPFYAYGAICVVAAAAGLGAMLLGHPEPLQVVVVLLFPVVLVLAAARATAWRLLPGRVRVTCGPAGVSFWRGKRLIRRRSWDGVQSVVLSGGDRWPEWSRAPLFASVYLICESEARVVCATDVLLVRPEQLAEQSARLEAVVSRYIDNTWPR